VEAVVEECHGLVFLVLMQGLAVVSSELWLELKLVLLALMQSLMCAFPELMAHDER